MKKVLAIVLAALLIVAALAGCAAKSETADTTATTDTAAAETTDGKLEVLKVGASSTPHAEILEQVKDTLAAEGYDLQIVVYAVWRGGALMFTWTPEMIRLMQNANARSEYHRQLAATAGPPGPSRPVCPSSAAATRSSSTCAEDPPMEAKQTKLELALQQELLQNAQQAAARYHSPVTRFVRNLQSRGSVAAVRDFVRRHAPSDAFASLEQAGHLELSPEATIIQARYGPLFTDEEINTCLTLLLEAGYF